MPSLNDLSPLIASLRASIAQLRQSTVKNADLTDLEANLNASSTALDYGSTQRRVGFRPGIVEMSSSRSLALSDLGHTINIDTTSNPTLTLPTGFEAGEKVTIVTKGTGTLALTPDTGAGLFWRQGGTNSTGARTIDTASIIELILVDTTNYFLHGNGIT